VEGEGGRREEKENERQIECQQLHLGLLGTRQQRVRRTPVQRTQVIQRQTSADVLLLRHLNSRLKQKAYGETDKEPAIPVVLRLRTTPELSTLVLRLAHDRALDGGLSTAALRRCFACSAAVLELVFVFFLASDSTATCWWRCRSWKDGDARYGRHQQAVFFV
jgi:hypothetical protein